MFYDLRVSVTTRYDARTHARWITQTQTTTTDIPTFVFTQTSIDTPQIQFITIHSIIDNMR